MKNNIITSIALCLAFTSNAQTIKNNVIASGGTILKAGNVQLEYTVGETFTNTLSSASNKITQGFHQPNILIARVARSERKNESETQDSQNRITKNERSFHFDVYPNPATDYVNVRINQTSETKFKMILVDETGKLIRNVQLIDSETKIDFTSLASGKYFITVTSDDGKQKESFKIVKLN